MNRRLKNEIFFEMAHFLKEITEINTETFNKIKEYISADTREFQTSQLYSPEKNSKFIDTDKRSSLYKTFIDNDIFDLCDSLIQNISKQDDLYNYKLVRNDVTQIQYKTGDFFQSHSDYLSINSNIVEEFTLILCLSADCVGGCTIFHINKFFKY